MENIVNSKKFCIFAQNLITENKEYRNMLLGVATFKCKQCGHQFAWFDIEGDFMAGEHLPYCSKCRKGNVCKASFLGKNGQIISI